MPAFFNPESVNCDVAEHVYGEYKKEKERRDI